LATNPLRPFRDTSPQVAADAFVADTAVVVGDVEIGSGSSVWFGVVIRADSSKIRIGERSNVQDLSMLHSDEDAPCTIGNDVTIGHGALVHGCTVEDGAQISMGAIVLSHAVVGAGAIVGAGALVPEGARVEPNTIVMGVPAKPRRVVTDEDRVRTIEAARHYSELGREYAENPSPTPPLKMEGLSMRAA
jgi:carbonic anhydrase/acetyltransferase-like protein (isoleucine patch superfamily)